MNLATSIFGMNFQQLNQSGQNIWVFVLTSFLAVILTGAIWAIVVIRRSYKEWKGQYFMYDKRDPQLHYSTGYDLVTRIVLTTYLIGNKHWRWTWKTNAWLCVLTNDRLGRVSLVNSRSVEEVNRFEVHSTSDYVSLYAFNKNALYFDPARFDTVPAYKKIYRQIAQRVQNDSESTSKVSSA